MVEKTLSQKTLKDICFVRYIEQDGTLCLATENGQRIIFNSDDKILISTRFDARMVAELLASVSGRRAELIRQADDIVWQLK